MTLHTPLNTRHSDREGAARTTIKESRFMKFIRETLGFASVSIASAVIALTHCACCRVLSRCRRSLCSEHQCDNSRPDHRPEGALVSGAQVLIVNQDTGVTAFNGKSDSAGVFVAPQVIPGPYRITVTAPGLNRLY